MSHAIRVCLFPDSVETHEGVSHWGGAHVVTPHGAQTPAHARAQGSLQRAARQRGGRVHQSPPRYAGRARQGEEALQSVPSHRWFHRKVFGRGDRQRKGGGGATWGRGGRSREVQWSAEIFSWHAENTHWGTAAKPLSNSSAPVIFRILRSVWCTNLVLAQGGGEVMKGRLPKNLEDGYEWIGIVWEQFWKRNFSANNYFHELIKFDEMFQWHQTLGESFRSLIAMWLHAVVNDSKVTKSSQATFVRCKNNLHVHAFCSWWSHNQSVVVFLMSWSRKIKFVTMECDSEVPKCVVPFAGRRGAAWNAWRQGWEGRHRPQGQEGQLLVSVVR